MCPKLACTGRVSVAINVDTIIIFWQLLLTEILADVDLSIEQHCFHLQFVDIEH